MWSGYKIIGVDIYDYKLRDFDNIFNSIVQAFIDIYILKLQWKF